MAPLSSPSRWVTSSSSSAGGAAFGPTQQVPRSKDESSTSPSHALAYAPAIEPPPRVASVAAAAVSTGGGGGGKGVATARTGGGLRLAVADGGAERREERDELRVEVLEQARA